MHFWDVRRRGVVIDPFQYNGERSICTAAGPPEATADA